MRFSFYRTEFLNTFFEFYFKFFKCDLSVDFPIRRAKPVVNTCKKGKCIWMLLLIIFATDDYYLFFVYRKCHNIMEVFRKRSTRRYAQDPTLPVWKQCFNCEVQLAIFWTNVIISRPFFLQLDARKFREQYCYCLWSDQHWERQQWWLSSWRSPFWHDTSTGSKRTPLKIGQIFIRWQETKMKFWPHWRWVFTLEQAKLKVYEKSIAT